MYQCIGHLLAMSRLILVVLGISLMNAGYIPADDRVNNKGGLVCT